MISEAFFIILVTGALNGAMCYGLYFKIKQELSEIRDYVSPSENSNNEYSVDEQIELQVVDRLNTPVDNTNPVNDTAGFEPEVLPQDAVTELGAEVICDKAQTMDEKVTEEVKDALDTIICGTSCKVEGSVDMSLLNVEVEKSDSSSVSLVEIKKKSNSSFLGLGSWLWQQDKTLSRDEQNADNDTQRTTDENA